MPRIIACPTLAMLFRLVLCCAIIVLGSSVELHATEIEVLQHVEVDHIVRMRRSTASRVGTTFRGELSLTHLKTPIDGLPDFTTSCRKIRLRQFIGSRERNCTSIKPVKFSICHGFCLPQYLLQEPILDLTSAVQKFKHQYRCAPATFRYKKVNVYCGDDGSVTRYRVKVVESCKCKEFKDQQNETLTPAEKLLLAATSLGSKKTRGGSVA